MADIVTTVKIRNADGTYTDEKPIGTKSEYIETKDGSTLFDILGDVDYNAFGPLQKQINDLVQSIHNLQKRVEILESK